MSLTTLPWHDMHVRGHMTCWAMVTQQDWARAAENMYYILQLHLLVQQEHREMAPDCTNGGAGTPRCNSTCDGTTCTAQRRFGWLFKSIYDIWT